jgi:hypothetical protein
MDGIGWHRGSHKAARRATPADGGPRWDLRFRFTRCPPLEAFRRFSDLESRQTRQPRCVRRYRQRNSRLLLSKRLRHHISRREVPGSERFQLHLDALANPGRAPKHLTLKAIGGPYLHDCGGMITVHRGAGSCNVRKVLACIPFRSFHWQRALIRNVPYSLGTAPRRTAALRPTAVVYAVHPDT